MKETQIIEIGLNSIREIIIDWREWLLGGKTHNWEYQIEPWGDHIILKRW